MGEGKRRRAAAVAVVLAVIVFAILLAVIGKVRRYSESQGLPKEESAETFQNRDDMTFLSESSGNGDELSLKQEEQEIFASSPHLENEAEFDLEVSENMPEAGEPEAGKDAGVNLPMEANPQQESEDGEKTAEKSELDQMALLLESMTVKEKVYQLFIVFPWQVTGVSPVTKAGELTRQGLEEYPVGGFIYDKSNMVSREQVTEMLTTVQTYSKIPLILTCDEEGGRVNRLMSTVGTTYIDSMMSYRDQGTEKAAENAKIIAGDMLSCGFNTDLAPVADVWSNPENKVIGDRAYSDDFAQAAVLVASAVEGFHAGGAACTLKHFPGHGDTAADSHKGAVYVTKTLDELREGELLPFQAGIDAGADLVMIGHLTVSDVEDVPAVFSYEIVTVLLRGEMGFDGVVITDSLQMKAVTDAYGSGQAAVLAVKAGVDILLCPEDLKATADALLEAVETGEISEERLNESVMRILKMKEERGIL